MLRLLTVLILLSMPFYGCSSVHLVSAEDLSAGLHGTYMGTDSGFHHFLVPEVKTVFYRHVKIPKTEYRIDSEMPYTADKGKWKDVDFTTTIKLERNAN